MLLFLDINYNLQFLRRLIVEGDWLNLFRTMDMIAEYFIRE